PVGAVGDGALVVPDWVAGPRWAAVGDFALVDGVALAPLSSQVDFAGVADEAFVAGGGGFQPVGEVAAVAGAACAQAVAVDGGGALGGFVDGLGELVFPGVSQGGP